MNLVKFTSLYFIFTGLLIGVVALMSMFLPSKQIFADNFWLIFGFMSGITYVAYVLVDFGVKQNPSIGIMAVMGSVAVKMIFCMVFVLICSMKMKGSGLLFALNFFSVYLLFTAFEMWCLLRNLRHQNL